ncbi:alpha/beta hydrolase [Vibrio agarivorans]|uniref:alpha/beta hydrolase n=1 Tax=Vibrio agarivorans TaxID=153622 RepID=UPI0025B5E335|nr:alpha/beta fold hydrolase [Vibrio agarivorans]MDN3660411.1 alpha/beta fold hydrolase [Vibrio agarivorans]
MKRSALIFCLVVSATVAFGPKVSTIHDISEPSITEQTLLASEQDSLKLVEGTEKRILKPNESGEKSKYSVVYLHGFSSSRQDLAPVPERIANRINATLIETRLKGHGRDRDAMGEPSVKDWLNDAAQACKVAQQLGEEVILIGTSTGGTLASWLGSQPWCSDHVAAIILISPNFGPADTNSELLLLPWGEQLARLVLGKYRTFEPHNVLQAKYWTQSYDSRSLVTMMGVVETTRKLLDQVEVPVLTLYSPQDRVVDSELTIVHVNRMSNPANQIIAFEDSNDPMQHMLAGDVLSPESNDGLEVLITDFLQSLSEKVN